jgi:uncharacterized phage protein gp47/JayE
MFSIPSLKDSVERARQAFRTNLPGSDAWLFPNNINPTAKVFGGIEHLIFGFADYIQKQKFALTADSENLDLHGEEFGQARRPAAPWRGFVRVTASAAIAFDVSARFRRGDGIEYVAVTGGALLGAGVLDLDVIATTDGADTTPIAGTALDIVSGASGDDTATAAISPLQASALGVDVEDDETFRARILFRKRNPINGGAPADYVTWASEVSGVTRVFVERLWAGGGTVRVFVLMDDLYVDGIPGAADVQRVADHLQALQPASAIVTVAAPVAVPVDIVISGLQPNTTTVQEAVLAELRAAFNRLSRVAGTDQGFVSMPYLASPFSFSRSWIWQAVANASGEERHTIIGPAADVALTVAQFPTLGNVTFI